MSRSVILILPDICFCPHFGQKMAVREIFFSQFGQITFFFSGCSEDASGASLGFSMALVTVLIWQAAILAGNGEMRGLLFLPEHRQQFFLVQRHHLIGFHTENVRDLL
jgi:hypothetical protein